MELKEIKRNLNNYLEEINLLWRDLWSRKKTRKN